MRIELIYDADCPNVAAARSALIRAFMQTGMNARWTEWDRAAPESPDYAAVTPRRRFWSKVWMSAAKPMLFKWAPVASTAGMRGPLQRAPSVDAISAALCRAPGSAPGKWLPTAATLPAIGAMFVPKLACPLCIPIIGSALGAAGVELFDLNPWMTGLGIALVALTLVLLASRARRSGRWGPWLVAALGGAAMLIGKFALDSWWLIGAGMVVFVLAAITGIRVAAPQVPCTACDGAIAPREAGTN